MADDLISARLHGRIRRDFPDADVARGIIGALRIPAVELEDSLQSTERLLTAAVVIAAGDVDRFRSAVRLARTDWRDLLMAGGPGLADWPRVLDEELGPRQRSASASRTPKTVSAYLTYAGDTAAVLIRRALPVPSAGTSYRSAP